METDPFRFVWKLCEANRTKGYKLLTEEMSAVWDPEADVAQRIRDATGTKLITYRSKNPNLTIHPIYVNLVSALAEQNRVRFTRVRTSAHDLAVKGRCFRAPRELRYCACGPTVQTEYHVVGMQQDEQS